MARVSSPALVVFARVPQAGAVKTRLTPRLSPNEAAELYAAFLGDALEEWADGATFDMPGQPAVRLYLASEGGDPPAGLAPRVVTVHSQKGDGLGLRMLRAAVETFAAGHDRVVIIGTDHPTLPGAFVGEAFRALDEPMTVVLGPTDDGGYYLIGLNDIIPALFEGLEYGHPDVLREAMASAAEAGTNLVLLPPWYDVDTPDALDRLLRERAAGAPLGPRTTKALDALHTP